MIARLRDFASRIFALFRSRSLDSRIDEELRFHLEMQIEENRKNGMIPKDARDAALRGLGGIDQTKEEHRDVRSFRFVQDFYQDFRFGWRMFCRKPKFAFAAVAILALAIGPNTATFSVIKEVLYRYLPYPDPDRLIEIWNTYPAQNVNMMSVSFPDYQDLVTNNRSLESAALYRETQINFAGAGEPERLQAARAVASLFTVLKRTPALGRVFPSDTDRPGAEQVAIISHRLWQTKFSGDPNIVGTVVYVNNLAHAILGVMPADFVFPDIHCDLWLPFTVRATESSRQARLNQVIARLKPNVSLESAQADLSGIAAILAREYPYSNGGVGILVQDCRRIGMGHEEKLLLRIGVLSVTLVLLIACANISSLLLARATGRKKEIAIRTSIGGARTRIFRQLLTESALLSILGGIAGVFVAFVWLKGILAVVPPDMPNQDRMSIDKGALIYTAAIALISSLIFGIMPALRSTGRRAVEALKEDSYASTGFIRHRLLNSLVVAETAMAVLLLILSGLLVRSYQKAISMNTGFDRTNLLAVHLALSEYKYKGGQITGFVDEAVSRFQSHLRTHAVAAAQMLPMDGSLYRVLFSIQGRLPVSLNQQPFSDLMMITPDYFQTLRIPLLQGRTFSASDRQGPSVAIISGALAKRYFADSPGPIGRLIKLGDVADKSYEWMEIVGVVGDVRDRNFKEPLFPQIYVPFAQHTPANHVALIARTDENPLKFAVAARSLIRSIDPDQPVSTVRSMEQIIGDNLSNLRAASRVFGILSVFALILAAFGIYSVISYAVSERTHEIGIRLAFGAQPGDICRIVLFRGLALLGIGLCIGLAGALASMRLLGNILFGITPADPFSYVGAGMALFAAGILAMLVPMRRALSVDPMASIRCE